MHKRRIRINAQNSNRQGLRSKELPVVKVSAEALEKIDAHRQLSSKVKVAHYRRMRAEFNKPGSQTRQKRDMLNELWQGFPKEIRAQLQKEGRLPPPGRVVGAEKKI